MVTVGKLADDNMQDVYLESINRTVNVMRDCDGNFIVSMMIAEALTLEYNYPFEEIEWCPIKEEY